MSLGTLGSAENVRKLKEENKEVFTETPNFTDDEIEVLKVFEEKCKEKAVDMDQLIKKLISTL